MTLARAQNTTPCFPKDLFLRDAQTPWAVAHTRPRHEKALAMNLRERGIAYYLPLVDTQQKGKTRQRHALVPLFTGYLFIRATADQRSATYETHRILQILPVANQGRLQRELQALAAAMDTTQVKACDLPQRGQRVRVIRGLLSGVEGVLLQRRGRARLVLQVDAINRAVRVEVHARETEVLENDRPTTSG